MKTNRNLITSAELRRRNGNVSLMTLWRWVQKGILPAPLKINGRNYWHDDVEPVEPDTRIAA